MSRDFGARLAATLDMASGDFAWSGKDLGDILAAQLDQECVPTGATVRSILSDPQTLDDLVSVKNLAKTLAAEETYPRRVANVLYLAAVETARSRFGAEISSLAREKQHQIRTWILQQDWVVSEVRIIFQSG